MKVSPVASTGSTVASVEGTLSQRPPIKMTTMVTPLSAAPELANPDTNVAPANPPAVTEPISPQDAELAKQRRALQVKERALQDKEKALAAQLATKADGIDRARLKAETLKVLREEGITYDDLTAAILADQSGNAPDINALKAEIKEELRKDLAERDTQAKQQVLAEMQRNATQLAAEGETFELVRETRSIPHVMSLIERTYDETGEVLDVQEALQLVEAELIKDGLKLAGIKKVQSQFAPQPAPPPQQQRQPPRTLTNRDTASVPMGRKERALAAFLGTLKK